MSRIWVDLTNTAHVVVLRPLVQLLEDAGHEVVITARPLSHTIDLLEDWGHPFVVIGRHGGARRPEKARAAASRARQMIGFGRTHGPFDAAMAHGSTDLPIACRVLRIANATMFDYEFAIAQHNLNCRLASRVVVPEAIPLDRLSRFGVREEKLVRYPGLKEEYILNGFTPDPAVLEQLGVDASLPLAVVRTAPSYALYLGGSEARLLPRLLHRLDERGIQTVVLVRNAEQAEQVQSLNLPQVVVPPRAVEARSLVAFADAVVSAGGSMNREAAALGTPVWSMFEGRMGAVDEALIREGRLRMLDDVDDVEVLRRDRSAVTATRDPADLLRLVLGGWIQLSG